MITTLTVGALSSYGPNHIQAINSEFSNTKNDSAGCEYSLVTKNLQPQRGNYGCDCVMATISRLALLQ